MVNEDGESVFQDSERMWQTGLKALEVQVRELRKTDHLDFGMKRLGEFCRILVNSNVSYHDISLMLDGQADSLVREKHQRRKGNDG